MVTLPRLGSLQAGPTVVPDHALIMVVDDDRDVRDGIVELLQKRGYRVVQATDGAHALGQLRSGVIPALILLDLQMPRMTGEELAAECARDPALAGIPILIISSDTTRAVKVAASGARGFLSKPMLANRLISTIQNLR